MSYFLKDLAMPTSAPLKNEDLYEWVQELSPKDIIDLGAGDGQTMRPLNNAAAHITGVEGYAPYIRNYGLTDIYDDTLHRDIRDVEFNQLLKRVNLLTCLDVLEHIPACEAEVILGRAAQSIESIIVSIPLDEYPQGPVHGNQLECHRASWSESDIIKVFEKVGLPIREFKIFPTNRAGDSTRPGDRVCLALAKK